MDYDLFKLCKEVYSLELWDEPLEFDYAFTQLDNGSVVIVITSHMGKDGEYFAPLYISDYLLEKLPRQIMGRSIEIYGFDEENGMYLVRYDVMGLVPSNQSWYGARADTLLKALLKLTLALHEAGEPSK